MAWKGEETEEVTTLHKDDIKWAQWLRVARNFQLRVGLKERKQDAPEGSKERTRETFDGFLREVSPSVTATAGRLFFCQGP
jgi:structure-specific recognition protein 1